MVSALGENRSGYRSKEELSGRGVRWRERLKRCVGEGGAVEREREKEKGREGIDRIFKNLEIILI